MVPFVLLTSPRSGSTWVVDTLATHPQVTAYGEVFMPGRTRDPRWGAQGFPFYARYLQDRTRRAHPLTPTTYLRALYRSTDARAVGFKLMYGQARRHPSVAAYLGLRRVRVVHLIRENGLDVALSRRAAAERRVTSHADAAGAPETVRLIVPTQALVQELRAHERSVRMARRMLRAARMPVLELTYEQLFSDTAANLESILGFLGLEPDSRSVAPRLRKVNVSGHAERIANYEDVRRVLTEAGFGSLLRD